MSERRFAQSHVGFWNSLLPMEEAYLRAHNAHVARFTRYVPFFFPSDAEDRGLINELAFRLFEAGFHESTSPSALSPDTISRCAEETLRWAGRPGLLTRVPTSIPITEIGEAQAIAMSLASFFSTGYWNVSRIRPPFQGCGWLDEAEGDVLAGTTIVEVKAGARLFRGIDLRQLLCYCALNFSSKTYDIDRICLVNPRSGIYFADAIEHVCQQTAGASAEYVLGEIVNYISEPTGDIGLDSSRLQ